MKSSRAVRRRVKIGATIDPLLLNAVDSFIEKNPGIDRSAVIDQALALWWARQQEREMEQQFAETPSADEREEREAWRSIQGEAAKRIFSRG